jgi:hypothetical protein
MRRCFASLALAPSLAFLRPIQFRENFSENPSMAPAPLSQPLPGQRRLLSSTALGVPGPTALFTLWISFDLEPGGASSACSLGSLWWVAFPSLIRWLRRMLRGLGPWFADGVKDGVKQGAYHQVASASSFDG